MEWLYFFEGVRSQGLTAAFTFFSWFGETFMVLGIILAVLWFVDKHKAYRLAAAFFLTALICHTLKITFRIDRPWIIDPSFSPLPGAVGSATGYSFPSGHTQGAATLYTALAFELYYLKKWKWQIPVAALLIAGVGTARMYAGVHTPLDVFTALGISLLFTAGYYLLTRKRFENPETLCGFSPSRDLTISLCLALASLGVIIYSLVLDAKGLITVVNGVSNVKDSLVIAGSCLGFAIGRYVDLRWLRHDWRAADKVWIWLAEMAIGGGTAFGILEGMKLFVGSSMPTQPIRYCLTVVWIMVFYPMILRKVRKNYCKEK